MINEISNKIPAVNQSKKTDIKHDTKGSSARPELDNRTDQRQIDTVDISDQQPVSVPDKKGISPVHGHDIDVQLPADVTRKESHTDSPAAPNIHGPEKDNNEVNGRMELTDEEQKEVTELQNRDNEVRQHEYAHIAAAGAYAQGVSFQYQTGPDGRRYAAGGEVSIDTAPVHDNPDATIAKARVIRAAANAPASPSAQDRQVAAAATRMEAAARTEKMQDAAESREGTETGPQTAANTIAEGNNEQQNAVQPKDTQSLDDALTAAYGRKETGIGKVIRLTV